MASRYLLETSATDGYLLEDASGVLLLEPTVITVPAGIASETDSSFSLPRSKKYAPGVSPETDSSLAPQISRTKPVGIALEADSTLALGVVKIRAVGVASESDTSLALGRSKIRAVGFGGESDAALTVGRLKLYASGMAGETDAALAPLVANQSGGLTVGMATELDFAFSFLLTKSGHLPTFVGRRR